MTVERTLSAISGDSNFSRLLTSQITSSVSLVMVSCASDAPINTDDRSGVAFSIASARARFGSRSFTMMLTRTPQKIASRAMPTQAPSESKSAPACPMTSTFDDFEIATESAFAMTLALTLVRLDTPLLFPP